MQASLMASLGLIRQDVLRHLKQHRTATQDQLLQALNWPSVLVTMSIGALIREERIAARSNGEEMTLSVIPEKASPAA